MEFGLSPELAALSVQAHAVGKLAAEQQEIQEDSWLIGTSEEFSKELGVRGWLGMTWPVDHGGGGRTVLERFVVFEALIAEGAPVATSWFADRQIGPTLMQYGTREQCEQWLPEIISGTSAWCIGMSEPAAGSDVAALQTSAVQNSASSFIVNGQKVWTSGAAHADWCYLIARTDPQAAPHAGLSEFVVDMRSPGIEVRPILDVTGNAHFCEVFFTDVEVPASHLVGALNGSFKQVMRQMEHERGGIDRLVSNRSLYLDAVKQADMSDPLVRNEFAALESGYAIGRLL
ncbi:MAG: acyl-CoA dehydrogenase family protein, partial [Microthrixaceae bacterium]